jgi:uncharacterized cupin superfamily protein
MMDKAAILAKDLERREATIYPGEFATHVKGRARARLGDLFGLTQFGVNYTTLQPGTWSSHRHWHQHEDEFIMVLEGEVTLVNDEGRHKLTPGMCAGFKAGVANGHHFINESRAPVVLLEIGTRSSIEVASYPDVDMHAVKSDGKFNVTRKDGSAF